jgi:hypothetical protein
MEYLELLYADRIRALGLEMQASARQAAENAAGDNWEDRVDQWEYKNPCAAFIEAAHEELAAIAKHVRQL